MLLDLEKNSLLLRYSEKHQMTGLGSNATKPISLHHNQIRFSWHLTCRLLTISYLGDLVSIKHASGIKNSMTRVHMST